MYMSVESLLIILLVGLVAGWLTGQIVQGTGFGIIGDLLIGIVGAFIGSWLLPQLGTSPRLRHDLGDREQHHRCALTVAGPPTRSRSRRTGKELGRRLGATLVPHAMVLNSQCRDCVRQCATAHLKGDIS
jgi:uncharacterized membrane protein YeaQ/YmgE (transglycosylase-associated protein family)